MSGEDIIHMSLRELKRLKVIEEVIERRITQRSAALMIGLSERQVRRFVRAVREEGGIGIVHKARGRPSNRKVSEKVKARVLKLYEKKYRGFGPTLTKEMRLVGIKTKEEANGFLKDYLPKYNKRFRVCAANQTDVHVRLPRYFNLDSYLCVKTKRIIRNDHTIACNGKLYQVEERVKTRKVIVEERLNGSLHITSNGTSLKYSQITERPNKEASTKSLRPRTTYIPPKDHPWRRWQPQKSITTKKAYTY